MITLRIALVVALQTLALAYMIADRQTMLNSSRVVTLKVAPVDPRDIFRGDYVILSYSISRLDPRTLEGDDRFTVGEIVYVTLQQKTGLWDAIAVKRGRPLLQPGSIAMKGTVHSADYPAENQAQSWITVSYGIESYFVPEGTGRAIEEERQKGDLSADIAVDPQGRAAIKALRRQDQVFYVEGVF